MSCMKCGATPVMGSDVCLAHGGKPTDNKNEKCRHPKNMTKERKDGTWFCSFCLEILCKFGEVHVDGVPCRWCDPVEGEW